MHGVQAIANAAPATTGPPRPARSQQRSTCHSRPSARDERRRHEEHAQHDDDRAAETCSSVCLFLISAEPIAVAPSPSRMKIDEKLAMNSRLGTSTRRAPAPLRVGRRDADDGREVARHERQHARREEGHRAGGDRGEDADTCARTMPPRA